MSNKESPQIRTLVADLPTFDRSVRVERTLSSMSELELRLTALQAIDAAHHAAAEVAETKAIVEGALGESARLGEENRVLQTELDEIRVGIKVAHQTWTKIRTAANSLGRTGSRTA